MQHQSTTNTAPSQIIYCKNPPQSGKVVVQQKRATLIGALARQIAFQGNDCKEFEI